MNQLGKRIITTVILFIVMPILVLAAPITLFLLSIITIYLAIFIYEWPKLFDYRYPAFWLIMPIYPLLPLLLIIKLQYSGFYLANLFLIFAVGAHDTGSYIAGTNFGYSKILPTISPGKTWEGFIGGLISTFIFSLIFFDLTNNFYFYNNISRIFLLTIAVCLIALAGDLFESYLKRRVSLKDVGDILPGHGGILDRADSLFFVVFLIYFIRHLFK